MDSQNESAKRCPHYQIYSEPLALEGPPAYLAIRRCVLAERLIQFLRQSAEGNLLADKLVVHVAGGNAYAFVGPDLEAVTQTACTVKRCAERCAPAYAEHLERFGLTDPQGESVTCDENAPSRHQENEEPDKDRSLC